MRIEKQNKKNNLLKIATLRVIYHLVSRKHESFEVEFKKTCNVCKVIFKYYHSINADI